LVIPFFAIVYLEYGFRRVVCQNFFDFFWCNAVQSDVAYVCFVPIEQGYLH